MTVTLIKQAIRPCSLVSATKAAALTAPMVRELLSYDDATGLMHWKVGTRAGKQAGCNSNGYVVVGINRVLYHAHRVVWLHVYGRWPEGVVDHINGNKSDNRIANLRDVSHGVNVQNAQRLRRNNTSGYPGVWFNKTSFRWAAEIIADGVKTRLGLYETPEAAYAAYLTAKRNLHVGCTL